VDTDQMPAFQELPAALEAQLLFDKGEGKLRFAGPMSAEQRDALLAACPDESGKTIIRQLFEKSRLQVLPKYVVMPVDVTGQSADAIRKDLKEKVEGSEIFAFVEFGPKAVLQDVGEHAQINYYTARTTYRDLRDWVAGAVSQHIQDARMKQKGLNPTDVAWAMHAVRPPIRNIRSINEAGQRTSDERANEIADLLLPMGLMMLMFMVIMVGATPLVHSVLEEKMQRIAEVLVASVPPFQLMLGKLLGIVGVSLTIVSVYLVGGYLTARHYGYADLFPLHLLGWFFVYQALAVIMFGSMFIAVGAACTEMKETQSTLMPVMLLACFPMFIWVNVVKEPTSMFATSMSFIPVGTPMLMILRLAAAPEIPIWQPILGVVLVLATTLLCVFAAGRIFRVGILMQGKGARISEMMRWVFRG
jgi:ABC-2 type transport system permease protein